MITSLGIADLPYISHFVESYIYGSMYYYEKAGSAAGAATAYQAPFLASPLNTQFYHVPENKYVPRARLWLPRQSVFERLTNPQYFTGAHRERFDEFGNGRGLAGREYVYVNDGLTESPSRCHEVFSTVVKKPRSPVVEPNSLGIQKFGVQQITPKLLWLYRNGDKHDKGEAFFVRSHVKTLQHLYRDATKVIKPIAGPVRKLYDQELRPIRHLEELIDGAKYLCTSGEGPAPLDRLEKFLSGWVVHPFSA